MTHEELVKKVNTKANWDAQEAIRVFGNETNAALLKLCCGTTPSTEERAKIFKPKISGLGWPSCIWRRREAKIMDDVLSTMNTLQKVLLAKECDGDASCEETK